MSSVVDISFSVFEKFNPTENEVKLFIEKLNEMIPTKKVKKTFEYTEDEIYAREVEEKLKSKMFAPKK